MTRPTSPSLYLLGFVLSCVCFIVFRTPDTLEKSRSRSRAVSQQLLNNYEKHEGVTILGEFVGVGTSHPDTTLHVSRKHPDIIKLENGSKGGGGWLFQIGGNGWQDGNLMVVSRPKNNYALVIEPSGKVVVMGDLQVVGKLTTSQPVTAMPPTYVDLQAKVDALTKIVEELLVRVSDLEPEDATVSQP